MKLLKTAALLLFISLAVFYAFWQGDYCQKTFVYPLLYEKDIKKYAVHNKIDPWLAAAVIKCESGFKASARSERGALGLMQIMPDTALWLAQQMGWPDFNPQLLTEPPVNIQLGCWYLKLLKKEFGGDLLAAAAYNAGSGQVGSWLKDRTWDGQDAEKIPFAETRQYVKNVLKAREAYQRLYKEAWE